MRALVFTSIAWAVALSLFAIDMPAPPPNPAGNSPPGFSPRSGSAVASPSFYSNAADAMETIHQFDRFLLVFHYQETINFDQVGNLSSKEYLFGNSQIEINPSFVTNQHSTAGITQGKAGLTQVLVLEQPVSEASEASVHFIEANANGVNTVSIYEIQEKPNVFRCYFTRVYNQTDHQANTSVQSVTIYKGLAYPIDQQGEHITRPEAAA